MYRVTECHHLATAAGEASQHPDCRCRTADITCLVPATRLSEASDRTSLA